MNFIFTQADCAETILRCYSVMAQLRPHISEADFVERVLHQQRQGYRLTVLESNLCVRAVAGYRFMDSLAWGRVCYVDDLVTDASARSQGLGGALFDWLISHAQEARCEQLHLDSGVQRFEAHRFYLTRRMAISCHHFSLPLNDARKIATRVP